MGFRVPAAAFWMLLAGSVTGAHAAPFPASQADEPAIVGVAEARKLMREGRHDDALAALRPLAETGGAEESVRFHFGLAAVGVSRQPGVSAARRAALLDEAVSVFHGMLVDRPELVRVRLELARALYLRGEDDLARRHFEHVLAGDPPAGVVLNVNRFLSAMRARKRRSLRLGMALAPDSNPGAAPGADVIWIPVGGRRLPFTLDSPAEARSGVGIVAWAGGEYQYPLGRAWRLRAGGDIWRRDYRGGEFDRMAVSGHLGPRWLVGRATEASLLAVVRQSWLSGAAEHRDLGLRVEARRRLTPRATANATVSRVERRYDGRDGMDGPVTAVSLGMDHVLGATVRADLAAGWTRERPERKRGRNASRWVRAGMSFALPWGFTVGGSGTLRWAAWEGGWFPYTADGAPRRDLTRSLRVDVHNRGFTVGGFSPRVSLVREDRTSNAQLHGYERSSGELRFVRLF